jgi:hypothetical protein
MNFSKIIGHGCCFLPNVAAQAGRGNVVQLLTDVQSRSCLQPDG